MRPVGSGLPAWVDTDVYLTADEVRDLPEKRYGGIGVCLICGKPPSGPTFLLEGAHIARKMMGGRKKAGPTVEICQPCHTGPDGIDRRGGRTLAVRRDTLRPVLLTLSDDGIVERRLMV